MKTLIVEDDFTSRILLQGILQTYGTCHVCVNGREAVDAFKTSLADKDPYNLICLDIMMPEMDGQTALKNIRAIEEAAGISPSEGCKIIMTTALDDKKNIMNAFREQCDIYLVKPIDKAKLVESLETLNLDI
jgi:two-component system, chemotaxis family, chemotaxis protein CheY